MLQNRLYRFFSLFIHKIVSSSSISIICLGEVVQQLEETNLPHKYSIVGTKDGVADRAIKLT